MEAVLTKAANIESANIGTYVEFSRIEVPKSVKTALFDKYDEIRPKGIDVSDDEIQELVSEVRYGKNYS